MTEKKKEQRPIKYSIYKGKKSGKMGCFQFSLSPAYATTRKEEGAVFIDAADILESGEYDWENKIVFALSSNDIGKILSGFRQGEFKLYHKTETEKSLNCVAGSQPGTFFLSLTERGRTKPGLKPEVQAKVSLQPSEARTLIVLLEYALPRILGWDINNRRREE